MVEEDEGGWEGMLEEGMGDLEGEDRGGFLGFVDLIGVWCGEEVVRMEVN